MKNGRLLGAVTWLCISLSACDETPPARADRGTDVAAVDVRPTQPVSLADASAGPPEDEWVRDAQPLLADSSSQDAVPRSQDAASTHDDAASDDRELPRAARDEGLRLIYRDSLKLLTTGPCEGEPIGGRNRCERIFPDLPSTYLNQVCLAEYVDGATKLWKISRGELPCSRAAIVDTDGGEKALQWNYGYPYVAGTEGPLWLISPRHYPGFSKMYVEVEMRWTGKVTTMDGKNEIGGKGHTDILVIDPSFWSPNSWTGLPGGISYFNEASTYMLPSKGHWTARGGKWGSKGVFAHSARENGQWFDGSDGTLCGSSTSHHPYDYCVERWRCVGTGVLPRTGNIWWHEEEAGKWYRYGYLLEVDTNGTDGQVSEFIDDERIRDVTGFDWFGWIGARGLNRPLGGKTCDGATIRNKDPVGGWKAAVFGFVPMSGGSPQSAQLLPARDATARLQIKSVRVYAPPM